MKLVVGGYRWRDPGGTSRNDQLEVHLELVEKISTRPESVIVMGIMDKEVRFTWSFGGAPAIRLQLELVSCNDHLHLGQETLGEDGILRMDQKFDLIFRPSGDVQIRI